LISVDSREPRLLPAAFACCTCTVSLGLVERPRLLVWYHRSSLEVSKILNDSMHIKTNSAAGDCDKVHVLGIPEGLIKLLSKIYQSQEG